MRAHQVAATLVAVSAWSSGVAAQGLPFHTETALTLAFEERGVRVAVLAQGRGASDVFVSRLSVLPFAPHHRLTTKVAIPLLHRRVSGLSSGAGADYSTAGLGDVTLGAKWAVLVRNRPGGTTRIAIVGSVGLPTGSTSSRLVDGSNAPRPLQLGTGAVAGGIGLVGTVVRGAWGGSAHLGYTHHAVGDGFQFGRTVRYDAALGFRIPHAVRSTRTKTLQLYLEWNGTITARHRQAGAPLVDTGGHVAYVSPGVQWVVLPQLLVETSVQFPVVQAHNGRQPDFGVRPSLGARWLFF